MLFRTETSKPRFFISLSLPYKRTLPKTLWALSFNHESPYISFTTKKISLIQSTISRRSSNTYTSARGGGSSSRCWTASLRATCPSAPGIQISVCIYISSDIAYTYINVLLMNEIPIMNSQLGKMPKPHAI
jgi:hypothetical protein